MWRTLRAELSYSRPWLLGGLGVALGVVLLVSAIFVAIGDDGPPREAAAGIRAMFLIMAPLIVGFMVQTYRSEERRARLFLAGPITPRQIAVAMVLLPVVLAAVGLLAAGLDIALESLLRGQLSLESLQLAGYVGGLMLMMAMMGLLAQEATAAHRQRRRRAAVAGWGSFVLAVPLLAAVAAAAFVFQGPFSWPSLHLGNLVVAAAAGAATVALYTGRTDFTR